jgi:hypothetical protein
LNAGKHIKTRFPVRKILSTSVETIIRFQKTCPLNSKQQSRPAAGYQTWTAAATNQEYTINTE